MSQKIRTLLLYATNIPSTKRIFTDSLREELGIDLDTMPAVLRRNPFISRFFKIGYKQLSYVMDWQDAFMKATQLQIEACNINNVFQYIPCLRRVSTYELIIILHSAAGDNLQTLLRSQSFFQRRKGKLVVCFGNENSLFPDKISFARSVEAEAIVTQLPIKTGEWMYSDCVRSKVIAGPPGLNPDLYRPQGRERKIDIGFRGSLYSYAIGDDLRNQMLKRVRERGPLHNLSCDIQFDMLERDSWANYLNTCSGIPGAEASTGYLEKTDQTYRKAILYLREHPNATIQEVRHEFFENYSNPVSGKLISSRHFEAIGTHTCQLLVEGEYNGILKANEHFIPVRKDFSDLDEALEKFKDVTFRERVVRQSYEHAMAHHTLSHRVQSILSSVL